MEAWEEATFFRNGPSQMVDYTANFNNPTAREHGEMARPINVIIPEEVNFSKAAPFAGLEELGEEVTTGPSFVEAQSPNNESSLGLTNLQGPNLIEQEKDQSLFAVGLKLVLGQFSRKGPLSKANKPWTESNNNKLSKISPKQAATFSTGHIQQWNATDPISIAVRKEGCSLNYNSDGAGYCSTISDSLCLDEGFFPKVYYGYKNRNTKAQVDVNSNDSHHIPTEEEDCEVEGACLDDSSNMDLEEQEDYHKAKNQTVVMIEDLATDLRLLFHSMGDIDTSYPVVMTNEPIISLPTIISYESTAEVSED
ncbi:hypothetical protein TorRG33x02_118880 [Trema orientale]|uniref:Uncharacterized protein n=1 Tax=Trema orientale TaxID=63057 RepID=A0A2P5F3D9_TREOI|nr:hypothetical protein TorRG33x02_118880 [Trema orientale]